jgi:hypothetical protein
LNRKAIFAHAAERTNPIAGQGFKGGSGLYSPITVTLGGIIDVTTYITHIFLHTGLLQDSACISGNNITKKPKKNNILTDARRRKRCQKSPAIPIKMDGLDELPDYAGGDTPRARVRAAEAPDILIAPGHITNIFYLYLLHFLFR